jgi:pimeloyl-ACP methyl ester carboxylesterase
MAKSTSKKAKTAAGTRKQPAGSAQGTTADAAARPVSVSAANSAFKLNDQAVEKFLASGEHSGMLEDYFGEEAYRELSKLAREASSRSVRGGPRVLIIPGIMGSKLGKKGRLFDDTIWIDPFDVAAGNLADLRLNGEDPKFRALGVILFAYLKLKLSLRAAGYDADFYPYDWRKSISRLGQQLAADLSKEKAANVSIVAHSLGGLVTRAAVAQKAPNIKRVVMLGTPNHGSFAPVQVLRAVYPVLRKIAFIDLKHSAKKLVKKVFRTFPSLYEMMPWPEKFSSVDLYQLASWPSSGPAPIANLFQSARRVQQSLAPADERFTLIAGVNQETVVGVHMEDNEFSYDLSMEGDGTVPLALAELPGARTYFVEESHGSLPNNRQVAQAVDDILATGATAALLQQWEASRAGLTRMIKDSDFKEIEYGGSGGRALSLREQRQLLDELVSATSHEAPAISDAETVAATAPTAGRFDRELQRIVIGRRYQHRLEVSLARGSITDVDARAYVLGMFRDVTPAGAARAIDSLLEGTISEFMTRRMFNGGVGEISIIPTGRHPVRPDLIAFAGLGAFDKFNNDVLELVAENIIRTFIKTRVDDFATVLFGGASGHDPAKALQNLLTGFFRGLLDADTGQRFHGVTICETDRQRYEAIKRELYRLSSTPLFNQVEVTIHEIQLPPIVESRVWGARPVKRREPVYLIVRCNQSDDDVLRFESSILTSGAKAGVVKAQKEIENHVLQRHLDKISGNNFTFANMEDFGQKLAQLVLAPDIVTVLTQFPENQLVVVHDAQASLIPWETVNFGSPFPAATVGLSRRYLADNLSVAKWLEHRKYGPCLDVLLVVNPTGDLPGAAEEGRRIQELFGDYTSAVNLKVLEESQARKKVLLELFSSGQFDVVHYAGHAYFDPQNPSRSGILCPGREVLSGADLAGIGNLPALMFFNACEAARIRKPRDAADPRLAMPKRIQRNVGLAEAFMRGGVANYMGTYWPVGDAPAKRFAEVFYSAILQGKAIGQSLLEARQELQANHWVDWADYVLYGSPEFVLKMPST